MDQLTAFIQDRWVMVILVVAAIIIIIKVVKSLVKWVFILGLVAAIVIYGSNYTGEIKDIGAKIADYTKEEAVKAFIGAGEEVTYEQADNGDYVVTKGSFTIRGKVGSSEAVLSFKGQSITLQIDDMLETIIEQAKASHTQ